MHRTNIYLTDQQVERLNAESERTGLSSAEIIRRAIDLYLGAASDDGTGLPIAEFLAKVANAYVRERVKDAPKKKGKP